MWSNSEARRVSGRDWDGLVLKTRSSERITEAMPAGVHSPSPWTCPTASPRGVDMRLKKRLLEMPRASNFPAPPESGSGERRRMSLWETTNIDPENSAREAHPPGGYPLRGP